MWQQFVWYRNLLIGLPAARLKKGLICVRLTAPPVLLTVAGERCIAEVDMAEFIFGLLVGLAAAMISRSYFKGTHRAPCASDLSHQRRHQGRIRGRACRGSAINRICPIWRGRSQRRLC